VKGKADENGNVVTTDVVCEFDESMSSPAVKMKQRERKVEGA
jgi:hypothetical protein